MIMESLADGNLHPITDLHKLQLPTDILNDALRDLVNEEMITAEGSYIRKTT